MRKIINTYSAGLVIAILTLVLSASVFGQEETQIVQGCSESPYMYPGDRTYIWKIIDGQRKRVKIDRIDTGDSRFVFTFRPNGGGIIRGEKLIFTPFMFGMDMESYDKKFPSPIDNLSLNLKRYSQIPEENGALLNWDETILSKVSQTGDWYVIYQKAEDFIIPPNAERYIIPLKNLPADSAEVSALLQPQNIYSFGGTTIFASPNTAPTPASVKSVVKRLNGFEFDTTGMEYGKYWFTLQSNAVFPGQTPSTCAKTTPPVLIEIMKKSVNYAPTVEIKPTNIGDCKPPKVTAVVRDEDNRLRTELSPQTLTIEWEIVDNTTGKTISRSDKITLGTEAEYKYEIATNNLLAGTYTVKVTARDGYDPGTKEESVTRAEDRINRNCSGAGIVYFQFDEPYHQKVGNIKYDPARYTNPESWVAYNPNQRRKKTQCTIEKDGSLYPQFEFAQFFDKLEITPIPPIENNKQKLDEIIRILKYPGNEKLNLYLAGYADWQNDKKHNEPLANRRLEVVVKYLEDNDIPRSRIKWDIVKNLWDSVAQSCYPTACEEGRRHDRRVELIYFLGDKPEKIPVYDSTCPYNTSLINNDEIEWETGE